jgi:hypothetical protein
VRKRLVAERFFRNRDADAVPDDQFAAPSIAPSWNIASTQQTLTTASRSRDQEAVSRTRRILVIRLLRAPRLCFAVCEER